MKSKLIEANYEEQKHMKCCALCQFVNHQKPGNVFACEKFPRRILEIPMDIIDDIEKVRNLAMQGMAKKADQFVHPTGICDFFIMKHSNMIEAA